MGLIPLALVSLAAWVSLVEATLPSVCRDSTWTLLNGRCFKYISTAMDYNVARPHCTDIDPSDNTLRIADPRDSEENNLIRNWCKDNNYPWPSPWNVWTGTDSYTNPTWAPTQIWTESNYDRKWQNVRDTNRGPVPKVSCLCTPPSSDSGQVNWCMEVQSTMVTSSIRVGTQFSIDSGSIRACTAASSPTSCPSPSPNYQRVLCRRPASWTGKPVVGQGMCWLGASRSGANHNNPLTWNVAVSEVSTTIPASYNNFEPNLQLDKSTPSQYAQFVHFGYGSAHSSPNCLAMWDWDGTGKWIVDWCNKILPFACVADARCPAGYRKATRFSVNSLGSITSRGKCEVCPSGTYRSSNDEEALCINCAAGYYGSGSGLRTNSTCNGVCPAGTYCPVNTVTPWPCPIGYYGRPLNNALGPGWDSLENSCRPCVAGRFCDVPGLTESGMNAKQCVAGICSVAGATTSLCSQRCLPGYYCPLGSACPGLECGHPSKYCPAGSQNPQDIPPGFYGIGESSSRHEDSLACPPGFYCINGIRTPCPEGKYSSAGDIVERTSCKPCKSGYRCPAPASPTSPSSTSSTQQFCANSTDPYPAQNYCKEGIHYRLDDNDETYMTVPETAQSNIREDIVPCPNDKVCSHGEAHDRISWTGCPTAPVMIPELLNVPDTDVIVNASLFGTLIPSQWTLTYRILDQAFVTSPSLLEKAKDPACVAGVSVNDGIFDINTANGRLRVKRFSPDPFNPASALQFEACEPITDIRYRVIVQATLQQVSGSIQANITCPVTIIVGDRNDQPVFSAPIYHRVISESADENTPAERCNGISATTGCPDDPNFYDDPAITATDEDSFNQGNLNYSFVGELTDAHKKLKISSCTGLISQQGGSENVLRFSDNDIPLYLGQYKRLTYTVRVEDDGNAGLYPPRSSETTVHVYIRNINDRPVILTPPTTDFWIPESTSSRRFPAPYNVTPSELSVFDDDPDDIVTLRIVRNVRNDAFYFELVDGVLRTTIEGESKIDYESSDKFYSIDIEARDNGLPQLASQITINIRVANMNDPPIISDGLVFYIVEDAVANQPVCKDKSGICAPDGDNAIQSSDPDGIETDKTTYSLTVNPGGLFDINVTSGQVFLKSSNTLDFENETISVNTGTGRAYTLQVTATSDGVGVVTQPDLQTFAESSTRSFVVNVVDVNEPPVFVTPNATAFRVVETWPVGPEVSTIAIHASDPDNADGQLMGAPALRDQLEFDLIPDSTNPTDGAAYFSVSRNPDDDSKVRVVLRAPLNYETAPTCSDGHRCYTLHLRVRDSGTPRKSSERIYRIHIVDVNEAPTFTQNTYTLSAREDFGYASAVELENAMDLKAIDADIDDSGLTYVLTGGDGLGAFRIASLGANSGFKVIKKENVMLDYETKAQYTLRVEVVDGRPGSSAIGKECILANGQSYGCGTGAFCRNSRCYEICPEYSNASTTIFPSQVPRVDIFFCQDLSDINGLQRTTPLFYETAEATIQIGISDENDPPFIIVDGLQNPNRLTNANCSISGQVSLGAIGERDQFPFSMILVWDDDKPNPGPRAAPFEFKPTLGAFWDRFTIVDNAIGRIKFVECPGCSFSEGQTFTGSIVVQDRGGLNSTCALVVTITDENVPPELGDDFAVDPVSESAGPGYVVFPGYNKTQLFGIDPDTDNVDNRDNLTFSATFSSFFDVNMNTSEIILKSPLDYESSSPHFKQTILVRVVDSRGADDIVEISVPIQDANEAPFWTVPRVDYSLKENTDGPVPIANLTLFVSDPDIYAANLAWNTTSISISSGCDTSCPVEVVDGELRLKEHAVLDFETSPNHWEFLLRVMDGAGLYSEIWASFSIIDENEAPYFTGTASVSIPEGPGDFGGDGLIDMSIFVQDPDIGDPVSSLQFNITSGDTENLFEITETGLLRVRSFALDYESKRQYILMLEVADSGGKSSSGNVTIYVSNVNDVTVSSIEVIGGPNSAKNQLACDGMSRIGIHGTNLGMVDNTPPAKINVTYQRSVSDGSRSPVFASSSCTVVNNTYIECDIDGGGSGMGLIWSVNITVPNTEITGDAYQTNSINVAFPKPSISSVVGTSNMNTAGGQTIVISGSCLGRPTDALLFSGSQSDSYVEMRNNHDNRWLPLLTGCSATSLFGNNITCISATLPGLGNSTTFRVKSARQLSNELESGGYGRPTVTSLSMTTLRTKGTIADPGIRINGTNFGNTNTSPTYVRMYYTAPETTRVYMFFNCIVTIPYVQVTCTSHEEGVGVNLWLVLEFGRQTNPSSPLLNFEQPTVTSVATDAIALSPTSGGIFVSLRGTSFGPKCGVPGTSIASGAANCDILSASYTRGSLNILGAQIVYRPIFCAVVAQDQAVCTTVAGTGTNHTWSLTVGGQQAWVSPTAGTTSYSSPVVGAYDGEGSKDALTSGNQVITLNGYHFGPIGGVPVYAHYGPRGNPTEYTAANCSVIEADKVIRCYTGVGAGSALTWGVNVDGQVSRSSLTDYAPPSISNVTIGNSLANSLSDDGWDVVTLNGYNFGPPGKTYLQSVTYGPSTYRSMYNVTSMCTVISHEVIQCQTLPGQGFNHKWQVVVRGQASDSQEAISSFRAPVLYGISKNTSRTEGGEVIRIRGAFFGFCDPNVQVKVLFNSIQVDVRSVMRPDSVDAINFALECVPRLPSSYGTERILLFAVPEMTASDTVHVQVQVTSPAYESGRFLSSEVFTFRYETPEIVDVFAEPDQSGGILVTLVGRNFCRSEDCCQTYVDGNLYSSNVLEHTHDLIKFRATVEGTAKVVCPGGSTDEKAFTSRNPFVYGVVRKSDSVRIDGVSFPTIGGDEIYIYALFANSTGSVTIGGRNAEIVAIEAFSCDSTEPEFRPDTVASIQSILAPNQICTRILAKVPAGQGINNEVIIAVQALRSRADDFRFEFLAYARPVISTISASFAQAYPTRGSNERLTITGTNFGLNGQVFFGPTSSHNTSYNISCGQSSPGYTWSHTEVSCFVPPGEGSSLEVRILVAGQLSAPAASGRLRYAAPIITGFSVLGTTDNTAETMGGQTLRVVGTNFGREYNASAIATSIGQPPVVQIGASALSCAVQSSNHTQILCTIPSSDGKNLALRVIIAGESPASLSPVPFAYGRPVVYYVTPNVGPTSGKDSQGNRLALQIVGKNFGKDQLRVEFKTSTGLLLLGQRSERDFRDDFLYPGTNHTSIRVYLPSYFGAGLNVIVTVNGQSSDPNGIAFNYSAPIIDGVNVTRRGLAIEDILVDTQEWTSSGPFGNCRALRPANSTGANSIVNRAFKVALSIVPGGAYTRRIRFFRVSNHTEVTDNVCDEAASNFLGEASQTGTLTDLGEHPDVSCMRLYRDTVSTVSGYAIDNQLYPEGGFGYYVISESVKLFLSLPSFRTEEEARLSPEQVQFAFDDEESATLVSPLPISPNAMPTSGCYQWESEAAYRTRVEAEFLNQGGIIPPRKCVQPALISVSGSNFGSGNLALPGDLRVYLIDSQGTEYEGSTLSSGGNHEFLCTSDMGCVHEDNNIVFQAPFGSGRGLRIKVMLGNQETESPVNDIVDYLGPSESEIMPGTLNSGAGFMTTSGLERIRLIGENFGYRTSRLSVLLNGKPCLNTTWVTGYTERLGRASIECTAPVDVPGIKPVFVCVGGQGKVTLPVDLPDDIAALQYGMQTGAWNVSGSPDLAAATTVRALAVSRCPPGQYGRVGEKCLPCPQGGRCYPGFDLPIPEPTFSLISIATDSQRALEGACTPERLDRSQLRDFPSMVFYETCNQMVRCIPEESCLGANQCAEGYEYQLYRCRNKRNSTDIDNSCRVYFDASLGVYRGVNSDCQRSTEPNRVCSFEHPEDCSECKVVFDSPDAKPTGVCTCTQPQRCALCTATTHYRLNNECVECPSNPALIFSLFVLAGVACIAAAYYLQKRKINLAFLSVGIDYFQVLAVFASTNIAWPPVIRRIFVIFTLFLASIDIAAPECLVPNLEFPTKFYLTELLPFLALAILLSIHFGYTFYKVYQLGVQAKWMSHVSRLIGIYILIIYVLYLSLTKKALDVFNCNPLDPDDGYSYTAFSSLRCDGGGLCRCFEPGGLQSELVAPAIVFLVLYSFGFPLVVAYIVFKYREQIREDQYLRANRLGDRRETNPRAYDIRKRYQLMYMHFKPRYAFWMLAILMRKFGVAFASLMFRGNPSFQLAVILVVLFISFTLQVSVRPYMSPGEFPVVIKELNENSCKADEDPETYWLYRDLFRKVSECMKTQAELLRKEKMIRHKMGAGFWDESKQAAREHDRRSMAEKYFFDLNAVEAVLLGSTIVISLAGIMFESGRFSTMRSDLEWQSNMVVVLTFIVLFGSLFYYVLVFLNELYPITFARYCGRIFLRYQNDGITNDEIDKLKDNDIVLDANPLFAATGPVGDKSKSLQKEIEASKEALALAKRQNEELKRLKAELESGGGVTAKNPLALRELMNTGM